MPDPGNQYLWHLTPKQYDTDVIELDLQMQPHFEFIPEPMPFVDYCNNNQKPEFGGSPTTPEETTTRYTTTTPTTTTNTTTQTQIY
jgi:hypothetical protein